MNNDNKNFQFIKGVILVEMKTFEKLIEFENFGPAYRILSLLKYKISDETIESIENYLNQPNQDELNEIHLGLALSIFLRIKKL